MGTGLECGVRGLGFVIFMRRGCDVGEVGMYGP